MKGLSIEAGTWEESQDALAFTACALHLSSDDPALAALYQKVAGTLDEWERIDEDRRKLRLTAIAARAAVRAADAVLDAVLVRIAAVANSEERERLFPVPPDEVIALGLDGEIPAAALAMARIDEGPTPSAVADLGPALRRALTIGNAALSDRADAYAALGRLHARVESWHEDASATKRVVARALEKLAGERGLGARWVQSFFDERASA